MRQGLVGGQRRLQSPETSGGPRKQAEQVCGAPFAARRARPHGGRAEAG